MGPYLQLFDQNVREAEFYSNCGKKKPSRQSTLLGCWIPCSKLDHVLGCVRLLDFRFATLLDNVDNIINIMQSFNHNDCIVLSCIVLYCIVLYCIVLYCIVLYCIVLYCFVLFCIVLYCIVLYCIVLYCIVLYCIVLYCIVLYCIVLYCIVFYCIVLY